jgi:hypothetical protein
MSKSEERERRKSGKIRKEGKLIKNELLNICLTEKM